MSIFSDNYYSYCYEETSHPAMDERSLSNHDKRYHKHGYDPKKDRCKYRNGEEDKTTETKRQADIIHKIRDEFSIRVVSYQEMAEETSRTGSEAFKNGWKYTYAPKKEDEQKALEELYKEFKHLEEKFGFKPKIDIVGVVNFKPYEEVFLPTGMSENDSWNTDVSKLVISANPPKDGNYSYGGRSGNIRHEIGHTLITEKKFMLFRNKLIDLYMEEQENTPKVLMGMSSQYGVEHGGSELMAELFARVTDPAYVDGEVPKQFEDFVRQEMMGVKNG